MNTMKWLIRREFWEHKGSFVRAPVILAITMFVLLSLTLLIGRNIQHIETEYSGTMQSQGQATSTYHVYGTVVERLGHTLGNYYMWMALPIFIMVGIALFFYCVNALYDERRDRSVLFWKSLPIPDSTTVLSKVLVALLIVPVITIAIAAFSSYLYLLVICVALKMHDIDVFSMVLNNSSFYMAPFELVGLLPIYLLWALPTVGWLLMVSAWAKSKVFMWAVGVPVCTTILMGWVQKMGGLDIDLWHFFGRISGRLLFGVMPGSWHYFRFDAPAQVMIEGDQFAGINSVFHNAWALTGSADLWVGAIAGAMMIWVAIVLRGQRDDA